MPVRIMVLLVTMLFLLASLSASAADGPVPAKFVSAKPAFAKLALTADGSRVLLLAGDESGGTGTGYDTIYADTNFNGVIEAAEKVTKTGKADYDPYKPLIFDFGYNTNTEGIKEPLVVTLTKSYMGSGFAVSMRVRLSQDKRDWEYSFRLPLTLVPDVEQAPVLAPRPLTVNLQTRPGNGLGIAATLSAGDFSLSCYPPQGGPMVRLQVLNAEGQAVSDDTVPLDRLGFG